MHLQLTMINLQLVIVVKRGITTKISVNEAVDMLGEDILHNI